jgi:hypothetical protein
MPIYKGKKYPNTKEGKQAYLNALLKDRRKGKEQSVDVDIRKSKKGNLRLDRIAIDADDITSVGKSLYINNPFKKGKNLYTRETSKTYNKEKDKAEKKIITKVGDEGYRVKYKPASKIGVMKGYLRADKKIKKSRKKDAKDEKKKKKKNNSLLNALKRNLTKKKKGY